jgi:hypothetical protein
MDYARLHSDPVARPPVVPAVVAWLAVLAAVVIQARYPSSARLGWHWAGWLLGGVGTMTCLALHRLRDERLRRGNYAWNPVSYRAAALAAVTGGLVGLVHAYGVALWYVG